MRNSRRAPIAFAAIGAPVDDLTASRKGNKVQLDWTLPRKNTDRTLVKNIPREQGLPP